MTERSVTVSGSASAPAVPDVVRVSVTVHAERKSVADALHEAEQARAAVGQAARAAGLEPRDIGSTGASVWPTYDNQTDKVSAYRAEHSLSLTVRDVEQVNSLIRGIAKAAGDALIINTVGLEVADPEPAAKIARERAVAAARAKAGEYAQQTGCRLGGVLSIAEGGLTPPMPMERYAKVAGMSSDAMAVESGEQQIRANVTITWQLLAD